MKKRYYVLIFLLGAFAAFSLWAGLISKPVQKQRDPVDFEAEAKREWIEEWLSSNEALRQAEKAYAEYLIDQVDEIIGDWKKEQARLPVAQDKMIREVTAYTSRPQETDSTPCVSASGHDICSLYAEGVQIAATNELPLGTIIEIAGEEFIVLDRMNKRYPDRYDIYMGYDTKRALAYGVQKRDIVVKGGGTL